MTDIAPEEDLPPVAHVTVVYTGPVAPHWELKIHYGDPKMLDDFWGRVNARLLLIPKHDPQFRRNRERVNRDAERELITCDWDLGEDDADSTSTPVRRQADPPAAEAVDESGRPEDARSATEPSAEGSDPQPDGGEQLEQPIGVEPDAEGSVEPAQI